MENSEGRELGHTLGLEPDGAGKLTQGSGLELRSVQRPIATFVAMPVTLVYSFLLGLELYVGGCCTLLRPCFFWDGVRSCFMLI